MSGEGEVIGKLSGSKKGQLKDPSGVVFSSRDEFVVTDSSNHRI